VPHKYSPDTKLIFVGDATMSPYEILQAGGAIDHQRRGGCGQAAALGQGISELVGPNPEPERLREYRQSIAIIRRQMDNRMFPLTLDGLERGMPALSK
jgi:hypothetical protein